MSNSLQQFLLEMLRIHFVLCIRFGFSGENSPRCIIPTETISVDNGNNVRIFDYKDETELRINLVDFIQMLFFKSVHKSSA